MAPIAPLLHGMLSDMPFSPDGVGRWKLRRLERRIDAEIASARRRDRAKRLVMLAASSRRMVELGREAAAPEVIGAEWAAFRSLTVEAAEIPANEQEIREIVDLLRADELLTAAEVNRYKAAVASLRRVGRENR